jgi:hypothetical protein
MNYWLSSHETGLNLIDYAMYYDALPHMGSAFEVAEIVLSSDELSKHEALSLFTNSALYLAATFNAVNYQEQAKSVLQLALDRLNQECLKYEELLPHINAIQTQTNLGAGYH